MEGPLDQVLSICHNKHQPKESICQHKKEARFRTDSVVILVIVIPKLVCNKKDHENKTEGKEILKTPI